MYIYGKQSIEKQVNCGKRGESGLEEIPIFPCQERNLVFCCSGGRRQAVEISTEHGIKNLVWDLEMFLGEAAVPELSKKYRFFYCFI